jgi:Ribbon-helix-helix protein, copG family
MKTLTIRLPASLATQIEAEARARKVSKAAIVRERLSAAGGVRGDAPISPDAIADLIGSVDGLPADLSARRKKHLEATGYGRKRPR